VAGFNAAFQRCRDLPLAFCAEIFPRFTAGLICAAPPCRAA
jgi:hypothetical protein